jgi:hypothetical protein
MSDEEQLEVALVIDTPDRQLAGQLGEVFPSVEISRSDNFVGRTELAVFFLFAKDVLGKILGFVSQNRDRIKSAKLTIGRETVSLEGYEAADVERLMNSPGFQKALKAVGRVSS